MSLPPRRRRRPRGGGLQIDGCDLLNGGGECEQVFTERSTADPRGALRPGQGAGFDPFRSLTTARYRDIRGDESNCLKPILRRVPCAVSREALSTALATHFHRSQHM